MSPLRRTERSEKPINPERVVPGMATSPWNSCGDELHKAGKSDTQIAKPDVKPAESTVARTDSQGASNVTAPQPSVAVTPGDKPDQV
jgi:hypothetical protein